MKVYDEKWAQKKFFFQSVWLYKYSPSVYCCTLGSTYRRNNKTVSVISTIHKLQSDSWNLQTLTLEQSANQAPTSCKKVSDSVAVTDQSKYQWTLHDKMLYR